MKKITVLLVTFFVLNASVKAQYVTIPDPVLRAYLMGMFPACFNASQMLDTTCTPMVNATSLSFFVEPIVTNWDGFQYFKNLQVATFSGSLEPPGDVTLPVLPATLKELYLSSMPTLSLITLPPALERLSCNYRISVPLTSLPATLKYIYLENTYCQYLPALPASLDTLDIFYNEITALPALPASLRYLDCSQNYLTSLPALPPSLKFLSCGTNNFNGPLPILPDSLEYLNTAASNITSVPNFPASLKTISMGGNIELDGSMPYIPALPTALTSLTIVDAALISLPALPAGLQNLWCEGNLLTSLPPLPPSLTSLNCRYNQIYCLPVLPSGNTIDLTFDDKITCIPNRPSPSYNLSVMNTSSGAMNNYNSNNYPVCNAVNNSHGCQAFPGMVGHVYNDYNNNGVKDANEPYRANVKVQLSNGYFTVTNSNGYYEISSDSIGSYTLTVTPPDYFTTVPLQFNFNFNSYDTLVTNDFPLNATAVVDALSVFISPVNAAARPGFQYPYVITYTNIGTTTLTPNIVFNYDNSRLTYDSSSNAAVINNSSSLTLAETAMPLGTQKSFTGYFKVKSTAVIGDSIKAHVSIHANAVTATDSTAVRIRGPYDPNDKSATPSLSTNQVANGEYIYYTIRFQNTGTDTAFNIVISDSLSSQLQPSTLQVVNTSHPARITVNGNMVYCELLNIHLPDSNVNQLTSHGYVIFRIKPQPSVTVGSVIPNKAAIYFDYNIPVFTSEAQTTIYDASPSSHTYTFSGTGNWTIAANWVGGIVPPSTLQAGDHVIINGSCILNTVVTANTGSSVIVINGKSLLMQGNFIIQ